ncbi:MAG: pilus assembly protein, partial [Acidobacteria bacterium]|nr:pilus assembly protein [Acidobacteriota bacterium]
MDSHGVTRLGTFRGGDRGAVAVEMAIVVPVLVLLAFGMLEFGLAFTNKLAMSHAVNQATRHATVLGTDDYADIEILDALDAGLSGNVGAILHVDIFKANASGTPLVWDRYEPDGTACGWDPCPDPTIVGSVVYGNPADYEPCSRDIKIGDGKVDTIGV